MVNPKSTTSIDHIYRRPEPNYEQSAVQLTRHARQRVGKWKAIVSSEAFSFSCGLFAMNLEIRFIGSPNDFPSSGTTCEMVGEERFIEN